MNRNIVNQNEWNEALIEFAKKEAEFQKIKNQLTAERLSLPWVKIEKNYTFTGVNGPESLADLFQGRRQLIMQHFMFTPGWKEGCSGCSVQADSVDGARYHFEPKDVSFIAVSRAPIEKLLEFKERMGWRFNWVSSLDSDFNFDFHVSFTPEDLTRGEAIYGLEKQKVDMADLPGVSVFYKNELGEIFRTYSSFAGDDQLLPVYGYLDIAPKGRDEKSYFDWIKHHDKY